ncbi:hypothetical protein RND71_023362 [Anisodus tanguticus]|uniref:DUF4283 domain-containing protein n=1 Tax=Anisodus tanguticus TaxID=243964 RepID=A0AAE1RVE1_9SOLA|nr:hypothetical protein RND71_023362 [Anisodus tanguticus]
MGKRKKKKEVFKPLNIRLGQAPIELGINDPVVFPPIAPAPVLTGNAGNGLQAGGDNTGVKIILAKEGASDFTPSSVTLGSEDTASESGSTNCDKAEIEETKKNNQGDGVRQNKKAYASVVKGSRNVSNGKCLHFVKESCQDGPVELARADIDDLTETWGYLLIGYFAGTFPGNIALIKLCRSWGVTYRFTMHASGWIVFKFNTEAEKEKVMSNGPHFVYSTPLLLKDIPHCFTFDREEICTIPIWVRLPSLPLELWNETALSRILSRIGRPIGTDKLTNDKGQTSYARALVEIDLSKEVVHSVELKLWDDTHIDQEIIYEKRPGYCNECKQIGHYTDGCEKHKAEVKRHTQGKGVIHTPNATAKGVHTYLTKEGQEHGRVIRGTGGQPSGVQTGAGKGRKVIRKQDGLSKGKAQAADTSISGESMPTGVQSGGQSSGVQTGAGKGRTLGDIENGGQPSGTQTGVGTGRTLDTLPMDGQPAGIQTGVGKGRILEKEEEEKSKMSKVTDDQPLGSQTEAGKGGNTKETAKE